MKKKTIFLTIIAIFGSFLCYSYASGTFSRYVSSASAPFVEGIAIPIFNSSVESLDVPLDEMYPGQVSTYEFSVTNYAGVKTSDVSLDYVIRLERSTNMPLVIELTKNGSPITLTNLQTDTFTMPYGVNTTDNYELIITWPAEYNEEEYANLTEYIEIIIDATQKVS